MLRHCKHNANMYSPKELSQKHCDVLRNDDDERVFWMVWMTPIVTGQCTGSLNCLCPEQLLCMKVWTALMIPNLTSMFGLHLLYDADARYGNDFRMDSALFV